MQNLLKNRRQIYWKKLLFSIAALFLTSAASVTLSQSTTQKPLEMSSRQRCINAATHTCETTAKTLIDNICTRNKLACKTASISRADVKAEAKAARLTDAKSASAAASDSSRLDDGFLNKTDADLLTSSCKGRALEYCEAEFP